MKMIVRAAGGEGWLEFAGPRRIISAESADEVADKLRLVEEIVNRERAHAAGFITYEAAAGFDAALTVAEKAPPLPLLCFGIYDEPGFLAKLPALTEPPPPPDWRADIIETDYLGAIAAIKNHIAEGETYQVNFTYRLLAMADMAPFNLFQRLVSPFPPPYAAFIDSAEWAICSASPEMFIELDGRDLISRPMKGTAPRGRHPEEDAGLARGLRGSIKDRAENVMIVDMVRNDLGRVAETGSVEVESLFDIEKYPTVWQMTSTVRAKTDAGVAEIFRAAFPPASITGAPKAATMRIINRLEASPRKIYTGAIGHIAPGRRARFSVAIRTVLIDKRSGLAEYGVGGGVVWDSDAGSELDETKNKAAILNGDPRAFELLETMLWSPGKGLFLLERHLSRMAASARFFDFPFDAEKIRAEINRVAASLPPRRHKVRLLLDADGAVGVEATPLPESAVQPIPVELAASPVDSSHPFLYHKTTRREVYEQAARGVGADDVILWNEKGEVTETAIANLAVAIDGRLFTPPVESGLLPGTMRGEMLVNGELREKIITIDELKRAERIFRLNSVRGMTEVKLVGRSF